MSRKERREEYEGEKENIKEYDGKERKERRKACIQKAMKAQRNTKEGWKALWKERHTEGESKEGTYIHRRVAFDQNIDEEKHLDDNI
jgi:hypothetical protein